MKMSFEDNTTFDIKPRKKTGNGSSWAMSYGDMVTTLLCFFIIFYALEKQIEKTNIVKGYGSDQGILQEHKDEKIDTRFDYAIEALQSIPGISFHKTSQFVDIHFKDTVFFDMGSTKLTPEGKALVDDFVSRTKIINGKYMVEIQGHADSTPVKEGHKNRWWTSNIQLSVLRALSVHTYLSESYLDKELLVVSGHGNQSKIIEGSSVPEDLNRRISMRLHLIK